MKDRGEKSTPLNMRRILIVEDNVYFLQFLKETLQARWPTIDILEATNGKEALQKIETDLPDAIFTDLRLPGENGLELTQKIKARHPDIHVVIITNYDLPEYREAAHESGADHFVSKDSFLKMINSFSSNQPPGRGGSNPKGSP